MLAALPLTMMVSKFVGVLVLVAVDTKWARRRYAHVGRDV
jgi:hypothetical protein